VLAASVLESVLAVSVLALVALALVVSASVLASAWARAAEPARVQVQEWAPVPEGVLRLPPD
jgi:hypothetical protein